MAMGAFNCALVAGPLSPLKPGVPVPATRAVILVTASILMTAFPLAKNRLPAGSTATAET
jgi:hypothetical protein